MNRTEAIEKCRRILGFRTDLNDALVAEINAALVNLEKAPTKPWFLVALEEPITLSIGESAYDLPTDWIEEYEEGGFRVQDEDGLWHELIKNDLDQLRYNFGVSTGIPEAYAIVGSKVYFFPQPDAVYNLTVDYNRKDTPLTEGNSTNGYLTELPDLVIGMAGKVIAGSVRDKTALEIFAGLEAAAKTDLYRQNESKKHANSSPQMGGST